MLDEIIQTRNAGDEAFVDYLRRSVRDSKPWDVVFRELMLGPWDTDEMNAANRFLDKRVKVVDVRATGGSGFGASTIRLQLILRKASPDYSWIME